MAVSMKAARVNANLYQRQAAEKLGIAKSTLQGYESGKHIPKSDVAAKMAKLYGLPADQIIFCAK